jgi:hypothetical protein
MISRKRDPRFKELVAAAVRQLEMHGVKDEWQFGYCANFWRGPDISLYLLKVGKLDVLMGTAGTDSDDVHVLRRYKNGRGWFEEDLIDEAMTRLRRHMVLDELAGI